MREADVGAGGEALTDARTRRRSQVLGVLQEVRHPLPVAAVAERLGLHPNTTRFHLEQLVRSGVVERSAEIRTTPGRPHALYRAVRHRSTGRRSYRLLAEVLAGSLAGAVARPEQAATEAGRQWGRSLVARTPGSRRPGVAEASTRLVDMLDEVGFAPEAVTEGRQRRILLHHCPFLEAAQQNPSVVCAVHLGLMEGVLTELRAPVVTDRLEPFVTPDLCVAHLASLRSTASHAAAR